MLPNSRFISPYLNITLDESLIHCYPNRSGNIGISCNEWVVCVKLFSSHMIYRSKLCTMSAEIIKHTLETHISGKLWTMIQWVCITTSFVDWIKAETQLPFYAPLQLNSLAPRGFDYSLKLVNFKLISMMNILIIFCEIAFRWMPQHLSDH